jgi:hypothetical protein
MTRSVDPDRGVGPEPAGGSALINARTGLKAFVHAARAVVAHAATPHTLPFEMRPYDQHCTARRGRRRSPGPRAAASDRPRGSARAFGVSPPLETP